MLCELSVAFVPNHSCRKRLDKLTSDLHLGVAWLKMGLSKKEGCYASYGTEAGFRKV